ncbi:hypothetical protein Lepto7375DRAFT_3625 [Leptolyngbya sp. PCC 7375]|nr:hypothetical protein Lepto7375DRAFT_3625 [Leptolyngbya sp. PCC 7375]
MAANLEKMLQFIDEYQQQRPKATSLQIVRSLRAYTRASYANTFWELVAGSNPDFVKGELDDQSVEIMGQSIDFAHFMAALSDQTWGGNITSTLSDGFLWITSKVMTGRGYDSREYTAAIGDTAQPIEVYLDKYGLTTYQPETLSELLGKFASEQDYASDLVAFAVGRLLYENPSLSVKAAILEANWLNYSGTVKRYLVDMFGAKISANGVIVNGEQIRTRIYERIRAYLLIKRDAIKGSIFNRAYRQRIRPALINHATDYFIKYLQQALVQSPQPNS